MALYIRKPPVLVHAEQWDGSNESQAAIIEMLEEAYAPFQITTIVNTQELMIVRNGGGRVILRCGNWVVLHANGSIHSHEDARFHEMYQIIDTDEPRKQETHGTDDKDGNEGGEVVL